MKKTIIIRRVLTGLIVLLVVLQFFRIDKTQPPVEKGQDFLEITQPPPAVASILKTACYDCHSQEVRYPWYTNVAPVSFWIRNHINEGTHHLNFSRWGSYSEKKARHKLEECYEMVAEGEMPLRSYVWMHRDADLDAEQVKALTGFFIRVGGFRANGEE